MSEFEHSLLFNQQLVPVDQKLFDLFRENKTWVRSLFRQLEEAVRRSDWSQWDDWDKCGYSRLVRDVDRLENSSYYTVTWSDGVHREYARALLSLWSGEQGQQIGEAVREAFAALKQFADSNYLDAPAWEHSRKMYASVIGGISEKV